MRIWIDADSVPRDIRQILVRRCRPGGARGPDEPEARFVSARKLPDIPGEIAILVEAGPDAADSYIENAAAPGDLVVTRDIPFAERIASRNIAVINDRGVLFTKDSAAERRSLRDAAEELRFLGIAPSSQKGSRRTPQDTKRFADALDRTLTALKKAKSS
ncbi:MAG: DUF188 domain-containing protein [Spirochaetales bacterium]